MKKKKVLTIVLTVLLFLSVVFLGIASTFRVDTVTVEFSLLSADGRAHAELLQAELTASYKGESTFSLKDDKAKEIIAKHSYFRMTTFETKSPDKVYIHVVEDGEIYAVESCEGVYTIVSGEGIVVEQRNSTVNRFDGGENLLIKGITAAGSRGNTLSGDVCWESMLAFCQVFDRELGGIRKNTRFVEVFKRSPECFFRLQMREGVNIYIASPETLTEEKAQKAFNAYLSLSAEERAKGSLTISHIENEVFAEYKLDE